MFLHCSQSRTRRSAGRVRGQFGACARARGSEPQPTLRFGHGERLISRMRLALFAPDIPQNTGTILRMAACLGVPVDVIGPTGFDMTDRALKRAALDYLGHVELTRHATFAAFEAARRVRGSRLVLLTTKAETAYTAFAFARG